MEAVRQHPGRFFIVSFPEAIPSDRTLRFILDNHIGGLILFAEHCRDPKSLKSWLGDFVRSLGYPLIVAVDQEGGRVCRFDAGFPSLDSPRNYGKDGRVDKYRDDLSRVCERLQEIGVNLNLVPTVDLFDRGDGHVLDSRAFSDDPGVVAEFARATIAVHHRFGLLTCAKHFPGLGRSAGDPHQILSTADLTEADFREKELVPFRDAIEAGVDSVMVTHLAAPKVDDVPAIISRKMIAGWLKESLSFDGPVITDDLLMTGAQQAAPLPLTAVKCFEAGADLLLFGRDLDAASQAFDRFAADWQAGRLDHVRMEDGGCRVGRFIEKIAGGKTCL
ncbi:MAG: glycoside hydrolase family 3 N-terminal domain-containing protein [candidate division Zixibacteria bacterium]|nr:glycoside hydrolase family 3 N-terminal domain-containing protein [candidate division Zixibacteria bacterium]